MRNGGSSVLEFRQWVGEWELELEPSALFIKFARHCSDTWTPVHLYTVHCTLYTLLWHLNFLFSTRDNLLFAKSQRPRARWLLKGVIYYFPSVIPLWCAVNFICLYLLIRRTRHSASWQLLLFYYAGFFKLASKLALLEFLLSFCDWWTVEFNLHTIYFHWTIIWEKKYCITAPRNKSCLLR